MFSYSLDADLSLDLLHPLHAADLYAVVTENRDFMGKYLAWAQRIHSVDDMRDFMQRDFKGMTDSTRWSWVIRYQGAIVGKIGLWISRPPEGECELNYWLAESATGKGIITRAARVITTYAFRELDVKHLMIGCADDNPKSQAVAERLGFQHEFTLRDNEKRSDGYHDIVIYGMLADEWQDVDAPIFGWRIDADVELRLQEMRHALANYQLVVANEYYLRRWFGWMNTPHSLANEEAHTRHTLELYGKSEAVFCGIFYQGERVGTITMSIEREPRHTQLGYWLAEDWQGRGIMSRAVRAIVKHAFDELQLQRVYIRVASENKPSRALAERVGMVQEAILREENFIDGRYVDHVVYSLIPSDGAATD